MIWIKKVVADGTLSVKVNDRKGAYFGSHKGVRQGDPFAPFLFNMAANSLAKMISVAQQNGLLTGLADNIVQYGVAMLQYADDTILLIQDDVEQCYSDLFNCQSGNWPIKYLGTPISARRPTVAEMNFLGEATKKRMCGWNVTVAESAALGWNLSFRRFLTPDLGQQVHGLHSSPDAENIRAGAASLLQLATSMPVASTEGRPGRILRIADATMEDLAEDQMEMDD
nr:uncharacterized protein LOC127303892 [Lolium perenne]